MFLEDARENLEYMKKAREFLHINPGVGFDIQKTVDFVCSELEKMGYSPELCGKSGVIATIGKKGKTFLLRCDMDGLPIKEEAEGVNISVNDNMHACGHDMHTAMLLGAAKLLKKHEKKLNGTVKLMFQPAEELLEGAVDMINAGVLKNPQVNFGLMVHVMTNVPFKCGTVIVSDYGVGAPAAGYFTIKIKGKATHGAMPDKGIDPIVASSHIVVALEEINARELSFSDKAVLTIGSINGGNASNAIPEEVVLKGTLRAFDDDIFKMLKKRIEEISVNISNAFRTKCEVSYTSECPTLLNDELLSVKINEYMNELLGDSMVISANDMKTAKSTGSEDFSYISHEIPSVMVAVAAGETEKGYNYPLHHSKVKFDENALTNGSLVYAYSALRWLEEYGV